MVERSALPVRAHRGGPGTPAGPRAPGRNPGPVRPRRRLSVGTKVRLVDPAVRTRPRRLRASARVPPPDHRTGTRRP